MIEPSQTTFTDASGETPLFKELRENMNGARASTSYGHLDQCLDNISEIFKRWVDTNPADPQLAAIVPDVIALLDEHSSAIYFLPALDALEYIAEPARKLEASGEDGLIKAVYESSRRMAGRTRTMTDLNLGLTVAYSDKALGSQPASVAENDPAVDQLHLIRSRSRSLRAELGGMPEVTQDYKHGLIPKA